MGFTVEGTGLTTHPEIEMLDLAEIVRHLPHPHQ